MRTSITLDDQVAELANRLAEKETRGNFSLICEKALAEYCGARLVDSDHTALIAAAQEVGGIDDAIRVLAQAKKKRKAA
jgi:predicted transcriptional regulator